MYPELKTIQAKIYLGIGAGLCILFIVGALSGWKLPDMSATGGRAVGGTWGMGK